jgi:hypothetical protein
MTTQARHRDMIEILIADHREVERLFAELDRAGAAEAALSTGGCVAVGGCAGQISGTRTGERQ